MSRYACQCCDCRNWYLSTNRFSQRCPYCTTVRNTEARRCSIADKAARAEGEHDRRVAGQRRRRDRERRNEDRRAAYLTAKQQRAAEIVRRRLAEIAPNRHVSLAGSTAELPSFSAKQPNGCVATAKCATGIYGGH